MALLSLAELADLSIGTPEVGAVNFNALHTLLHAIIKQLNLQDVIAEMREEKPKLQEAMPKKEMKDHEADDSVYADLEKKVIGVEAQVAGMAAHVNGVEAQMNEVKSEVHEIGEQVQGLEKQMAALEKLPSGTDLLERTKSGSPNGSAVADMWQMMQMKKKIEANENGISKAMALFQDLLNEVSGMKAAHLQSTEGFQKMKEKLDLNLPLDAQETGNLLQTCITDQKNLESDVRNLQQRLNLYPSPEELNNMVPWDVLENCLVTGKDKSPPAEGQSVEPGHSQPSATKQPASAMDAQATKPSAAWAGAPGSQPGTPGTRAGVPAAQPAAQPVTPAAQPGSPRAQPGSPRTQPGAQPGSPRTQPGAQPGYPAAQPGAQPGYPAAQPGAQSGYPAAQAGAPGTQVGPPGAWPGAQGTQAGYTGPQAGTSAFPPTSPAAGPPALAAQRAAPLGPHSAVTSPVSPFQEKDKVLPSSIPQRSSGSSSASSRYSDTVEALRQIGHLADLYTSLQEQINHLGQIKCSHADLEKLRQFLSEAVPKNLSSMPADLPDQLSALKALAEDMKEVKTKVRKLHSTLEGEVATKADQKVEGSNQINLQLGYLRSTVHDIEKDLRELREQQDRGKAKLEQSVADTALYLQEQDEELLSRIQNTILQVQGDCENLNATTGNLIEDHRQKQKDISLLFQSLEKLEKEKADKEHLETEIDEKADKIALAGKVSHTQFDATTERLNKMMQDLLNKMSGQEQDWHKVLDKISVEMDSKLDRLELDPFRQQLEERWKAIRKQLKERSPQYEADDAAGIRKRLMAHFHCISCDRPLEMVVPGPTIMTIPSVPGLPSHRSIRPYTVYELEQIRQHTRNDKMTEMAEYGYLSMPRRCGGSHTLRRYTRLQQIAQCMPVHPEETTMLTVMKHEEVDILGLDGHIYKGRMDTRLPSIACKEGPLKTKPKLSRCSSQRPSIDTASLPARPHSAKLSPCNSGTARSLKDRPVSSESRLSRTDLAPLSTSTPPPEETSEDSPTLEKETLELHLDLSMHRQSTEQPAPLQ